MKLLKKGFACILCITFLFSLSTCTNLNNSNSSISSLYISAIPSIVESTHTVFPTSMPTVNNNNTICPTYPIDFYSNLPETIKDCVSRKGDYIYYIDNFAVNRIDIKNNNQSKIFMFDGSVIQLFIGSDGMLYYVMNEYGSQNNIQSLYVHGKDDKMIDVNVDKIYGQDEGNIYYSKYIDNSYENVDILKYNYKSGKKEVMARLYNSYVVKIEDNIVYYENSKDNMKPYSYNISSKSTDDIFQTECRTLIKTLNSYVININGKEDGSIIQVYNYIKKSAVEIGYISIRNITSVDIIDGFLYISEGDYDNQCSNLYKINLNDNSIVKSIKFEGIIESTTFNDHNYYLYIDLCDQIGDIISKKLFRITLDEYEVELVKSFSDEWPTESDSIDFLYEEGGYIWGYSYIEGDMFKYILCFFEKDNN